ncbi:MAG TPA: alginate lyase family protein [Candidatus Polarisedimenticolaceae bacterium]|nr:alginate lyase family protein [Candidatus Polarisedimenticolaceae bacterium]
MRAPEREPEAKPAGLGTLLRTVAPLGPSRILSRGLRPARAWSRRLLHVAGAGPGILPWRARAVPLWPAHEETWSPPARFRFLGTERDLGNLRDWRHPGSRLWSYHLHYLDGLRQADVPAAERLRLLEAWVAGNPPGTRPAWEPYPTALRLVNALAFLSASGREPSPDVLASLSRQAWWLAGTLEWDVGANHLWKNALALAWAGRLLGGEAAARWRRRGDALLRRELRRQVLADGFHYERTPTYHALLVEDLLRLDSLLEGEEGPLRAEVRDALVRTGAALATVLHPDGEIALLNDSAFGQAPSGDALVGAASARVGCRLEALQGGLPQAGILRLECQGTVLFFDVGDTGDRRQPGHAHADTLTLELSMDGRRVVVDAGVHDYEGGALRRYARGTLAHNTVVIDDADQSEMWDVFRVGRRARPLEVKVGRKDGLPWASAAHDGYRGLPGSPLPRRTIEGLPGGVFRIHDEVTGAGAHRVRSSLRVHPALTAHLVDGNRVTLEGEGLRLVVVRESGPTFSLEDGWYFPRMGERRECPVVVQRSEVVLPASLAVRIERLPR